MSPSRPQGTQSHGAGHQRSAKSFGTDENHGVNVLKQEVRETTDFQKSKEKQLIDLKTKLSFSNLSPSRQRINIQTVEDETVVMGPGAILDESTSPLKLGCPQIVLPSEPGSVRTSFEGGKADSTVTRNTKVVPLSPSGMHDLEGGRGDKSGDMTG